MDHHKKGPVLYVGLFALDPKTATKIVRGMCKDALLSILQNVRPQVYLPQGEHLEKEQKIMNLQKELDEEQFVTIQKDYLNFEGFICPKDNYHVTSLFIGRKKDKLNKKDHQLLSSWKNGVKEIIKVDFIVYVPNYLMTGYCSNVGAVEVSNTYPHMTLLLKEKASAVESNFILELLAEKVPQILKERTKKVYSFSIQYGNVSKTMFVINTPFQFQGVTGDNVICGRK